MNSEEQASKQASSMLFQHTSKYTNIRQAMEQLKLFVLKEEL
jgi:hypothetical protein